MTNPLPDPDTYLHTLTNEALETCTPKQVHVYRLTHGITPDGYTNPHTASDVARSLNITRQALQDIQNAGELKVYRHIALHLTQKLCEYHIAHNIPIPGPSLHEPQQLSNTSKREQTMRHSAAVQHALNADKSRHRT